MTKKKEYENNNIVNDLFMNDDLKEKIAFDLMDKESEIIEDKLTRINNIIFTCNDIVEKCAIDVILQDITPEKFQEYLVKFCSLRLEAHTLRINKEEKFDEVKYVLESKDLFNYYVSLIRDAYIKSVKEIVNKEK